MDTVMTLLPLLLLAFIYIFLVFPTMKHISEHPVYRFGNQAFWYGMVLIFNIFGVLAYYFIGQGDE